MKSMFKIAAAVLCLSSSAAFAAGQQPAPTPAATPVATATAGVQAQKKQLRAEKKAALAACKTMTGATKTTCKKDARAKEEAGMAALKAAK